MSDQDTPPSQRLEPKMTETRRHNFLSKQEIQTKTKRAVPGLQCAKADNFFDKISFLRKVRKLVTFLLPAHLKACEFLLSQH